MTRWVASPQAGRHQDRRHGPYLPTRKAQGRIPLNGWLRRSSIGLGRRIDNRPLTAESETIAKGTRGVGRKHNKPTEGGRPERMPSFLRGRIPVYVLDSKRAPNGALLSIHTGGGWGCPHATHALGKAWRLFAHGLQTLSRLLNADALSSSNPQRPFSIIKRGPRWDLL